MPDMKTSITIIKRNPDGQEVLRYKGLLLQRSADCLTLEARFDHADVKVGQTILKRGDRFIEKYYKNRWYNILEIHDREDDSLKGWYCNIGKPAVWEAGNIFSYTDLALDLWVATDGTQSIMDEDEFTALDLDAELVPKHSLRWQNYKKDLPIIRNPASCNMTGFFDCDYLEIVTFPMIDYQFPTRKSQQNRRERSFCDFSRGSGLDRPLTRKKSLNGEL